MSENDNLSSESNTPQVIKPDEIPSKNNSRFSFIGKAVDKIKGLNRNTKLALSLVLILVVVGVTTFTINGDDSYEIANTEEEIEQIDTAEPIEVTVVYSDGTLEYKNEDEGWQKVSENMGLETGMSLKTTGAGSKAAIELEDGSIIRIDSNTEVNLETLTESKVVIAQESGYIYHRVIPSEERTYIVLTENAQFQSVGTAFRTVTSGDEEAVEVFQSSVEETNHDLKAEEGEKIIAKSSVDPSKDKTVEKLDIETIKKDAFVLWNREQDLKNENFKDLLGFLSDFDGPSIEITSPGPDSTIEIPADKANGSVAITGKTAKGAKLTVTSKSIPGSQPVDVSIDANGNFTTPALEGAPGSSVFEFTATDSRGNKTTKNVSYNFVKKTVTQEQGIALTVDEKSIENKAIFSWGLVGITTPDGVKLVYSETNANPKFGTDSSIYVKSGDSYTLKKSEFPSGKTYNFKACRYIKASSSCDTYSNKVTIEIP